MKTLKFLATFVFAGFLATTLMGQEKSEVRQVSGFTGIDVSEGIRVELTLGSKEFVEVTADAEYIDQVVTELEGTHLMIYLKGNNWNGNKRKILVKVTATKINDVEASSGSSITSQNQIASDELKLSSSSGASLKIDLKATKVSCDVSSGASAKLSGTVGYFSGDASSGASIEGFDLKAAKVKADASSGASILISADEELNAEASSGASVKYMGSPKMVDIEKSSGGSVKKE
jgi:hypothetical protein